MRDQRPCKEFRSWREMVADPLIKLVMRADQVDSTRLVALLSGIEHRRRVADKRAADVRAA